MKTKKEKRRIKKRDLIKYPSLNPRMNAKTRHDLLDADYLHKLSEDELEWYARFTAEWVSGAFEKDKKTDDYTENNLHSNIDQKRELWRANNARNRCTFTINKATNHLVSYEDFVDKIEEIQSETADNSFDDLMQKYLDNEEPIKKVSSVKKKSKRNQS